MSGGWKCAKYAGGSPLDGRVGRHCEQEDLASVGRRTSLAVGDPKRELARLSKPPESGRPTFELSRLRSQPQWVGCSEGLGRRVIWDLDLFTGYFLELLDMVTRVDAA